MGVEVSSHFIKEEAWVTNKGENVLSFTLIREMEIRATATLWFIWNLEHTAFRYPLLCAT